MISIRTGLFETNSSSCHKLIVPVDQSFTVPKTLDLSDTSTDGRRYLLHQVENYTDSWIKFLYTNGIENIKYSGSVAAVHEAIEDYKGYDGNYFVGLGDAYDIKWPAKVILAAIFGEETEYIENAYSDTTEPNEDNDHWTFIWRD